MIASEKHSNDTIEFPLEQQIAFLRQRAINLQFDIFEILKKRFGSEGIEVFKSLVRQGYKRAFEMLEGQDFQTIATLIPLGDRMLGLQSNTESATADEVHYSVSYCPYLEESKHRGMDMELCTILEEIGIEEISKNLGEFTEPHRMCCGDSTCIFIMRNTQGK